MIRDIYEPTSFPGGFVGALYVTRQTLQEVVGDAAIKSDSTRLALLRTLLAETSQKQRIAFSLDKPVRYGATHGGFWFINDENGGPLEWPLKEQSGGLIPDSALETDR